MEFALIRSEISMPASLIAILVVSILVVSLANDNKHVYACSCERIGTLEEWLEAAPILFKGEVVSTRRVNSQSPWANMLVEFRVANIWHGPMYETAYVLTNADESTCGVNFFIGETYLVHGTEDDGTITTTSCNPTVPISYAQDHLNLLDEGSAPITGSSAPIPSHSAYAPLAEGNAPSGSCNSLADDNRWNIRW